MIRCATLLLTLALLIPVQEPAAQPAPGPRMVAEWEPALGALIRWPLGIPLDLVVELARDDTLYTLAESSGAEQQARSAFQNAGVNLDNVVFIHGNLWSMWTRDWGPQAVFDEQGLMAYADPWFDGYPWVPGCAPAAGGSGSEPGHRTGRGYEEDDALPAVVADFLGVPLAPLSAYLTGGNIMTDGLGTAWSTEQMLAENAPHMDAGTFEQRAGAVMGLADYRFVLNPEAFGIQHIDCYAKLLDERTVLVKQVPAGHPEQQCCEELAAVFSASANGFGRPFDVLRVFCDTYEGQYAAAYTNSLILNRKVLVPTFGIPADEAALEVYRQAMPGYQVIGFDHGSWYDYDALHCRTMGLFDPGMLRLLHVPLDGEQPAGQDLSVTAWIDDRSGAGLVPGQQILRWRTAPEGSWRDVPLQSVGADSFAADIPAQPAGAGIEYRLEALDTTGRKVSLPRGAFPAAFRFTVTGSASGVPLAESRLALTAAPNPFNPRTVVTYTLDKPGHVSLEVFDVKGRRVITLCDGRREAGLHLEEFSGRNLPSGVYFCRLSAGGDTRTIKMILAR
jgi:agmatine deiminase